MKKRFKTFYVHEPCKDACLHFRKRGIIDTCDIGHIINYAWGGASCTTAEKGMNRLKACFGKDKRRCKGRTRQGILFIKKYWKTICVGNERSEDDE